MEARIDLITKAVDFVAMLNSDSGLDALEAGAQRFLDAGVDLPTSVQQKILAKRLQHNLKSLQSADGKKSAHSLAAALNPFNVQEAAIEGDLPTARPGESAASGSQVAALPKTFGIADLRLPLSSKLALLTRILTYDLFGYLIKAGEDLSDVTFFLSSALQANLEASVEMLEDVPPCVEHILTTCRALRSLTGFSEFDLDYDAIVSLKAAASSDKETILVDVGSLVMRTPWYSGLVEELIATIPASKEYVPLMAKAMREIEAPLCMDSLAALGEAVRLVGKARAVLRSGGAKQLSIACQQKITKVGALVKGEDEGRENPIFVTFGRPFISVLEQACHVWPESPELAALQSWTKTVARRTLEACRMQELTDAMQAVVDNGIDQMHLVESAIAKCKGMTVEDTDRMTACVDFAHMCLTMVRDLSSNQRDGYDHMLLDLLAMLPGDSEVNALIHEVHGLKLLVKVEQAMGAHSALGPNLEDRVIADSKREGISEIIRSSDHLAKHFGLDFKKPLALNLAVDDFTNKILRQAALVVSDVHSCMDHRAKAALSEKLKGTEQWAAGSISGQSWKATLTEASSMEEVLAHGRATVMLRKPAEYAQAQTEISALLQDYTEVCELFSKKACPDTMQQANDMRRLLKVSHGEGLLVHVIGGADTDKMQLKMKVQGIKKKLGDELWGQVQAMLRKRGSDAMRLR